MHRVLFRHFLNFLIPLVSFVFLFLIIFIAFISFPPFYFILSIWLVPFRFFHLFLFHYLSFHLISDHLISDHLISPFGLKVTNASPASIHFIRHFISLKFIEGDQLSFVFHIFSKFFSVPAPFSPLKHFYHSQKFIFHLHVHPIWILNVSGFPLWWINRD